MPSARSRWTSGTAVRGAALVAGLTALAAWAQTPPPPLPTTPGASAPTRSTGEQGLAWTSLTPAQRQALKPLERDWPSIDGPRKNKWLEIAGRYPSMAAQDQERLQARMAEWARMTPQERTQTRLQFQDAKQVPAQDRQASWEAYQALPEDERRELANRGKPVAAAASAPAGKPVQSQRAGPAAGGAAQPKSNAVPEATAAAPPKPVAPSVVQARPGATTTLITKTPAPPAHQPSGGPKIAATSDYVDKKTLLPQTGPQSTAATPPAKATPAAARP